MPSSLIVPSKCFEHLEAACLQHWASGMFYRNHNLKQAIGLLGVVLALLFGIQQSLASCYLAGCSSPPAAVDSTDGLVDASTCSDACCGRQTKLSLLLVSGNDASPGDSCPCPSTCWCHQTLVPLGLPTSAPESLERLAQSMGQFCSPTVASVGCEQGLPYGVEATIGASPGSTPLRCAKLCRFLI